MEQKKVKWFSGETPAEIYQSFNMKFAFANVVDGNIVQCHQWVKCRDFLHDVIRTMLTGKRSNVWSFIFDKTVNPPIAMDKLMLLVSKKSIKDDKRFSNVLTKALKLINCCEDLRGINRSVFEKVQPDDQAGYKHVWLFTGNAFWLKAPHLISLYTLLLRLGNKDVQLETNKTITELLQDINEREENTDDNDLKYLKDVWDKVEILINKHDDLTTVKNDGFSSLYYDDTPIKAFHDGSGIVSVCTAETWSHEFNEKLKQILDIKEP